MSTRTPIYLLVIALLLTGSALIAHRNIQGNIPLLPDTKQNFWDIEATVIFRAQNTPVQISLSRPVNQPNFEIMDEAAASPGYGLTLTEEAKSPQVQWTKRSARGEQRLYYRIIAREDSDITGAATIPPSVRNHDIWSEPNLTAANELILTAWQLSADPYSFTRELLKLINSPKANQNVRLLLNSNTNLGDLVVRLLNHADIPANQVSVLKLEDGRRRQSLDRYIRVWSGTKSQLFNPKTGSMGLPQDTFLWESQGQPILQVEGGSNSRVEFSVLKRVETAAIANQLHQADVLNFSIAALPLAEQALFKTILLIPIGALVVVFLRIIIGIKTSGTFMPVLIALAFMETSLTVGLIGFVLVVSAGLVFRSYLSHLNLLLVARISAVIITVIGIITLFSVLSYQFGLSSGLKITFFPMIILAWTIERMSILWEEEGPKDVLIQGGGSLLVAILAYQCMSNAFLQHLAFNFLGLQFIIMAMILLLGSYSGYRLSELKRFKSMIQK